MIVRTYGRRSRGTTGRSFSETPPSSLNDDVYDPFAFKEDDNDNDNDHHQLPSSSSSSYYNNNNNSSFSQETLEFQKTSQETFNFTFSSQDSTRFLDSVENDSNLGSPLQLLKPRRREKARKLNDGRRETAKPTTVATTASLMETQECGEMMECVDEVEFALDGLRKGQKGVRVRRASLLSLLNVCSSSHQRRLLKAQGMAKTIIDAILDLSLDDSPSNLAAATLFYTLANDSQDSYLVDSAPSIQFLLKLLKPVVPETTADKAPSISQRLLGLRKDMLVPHDIARKIDSSSTAIAEKVLEALVSFKDLKASITEKGNMSRRELNPDWVSLLTMEKACLSTISIEDTTGTVRKTGGNFKDKLRELGGLTEVFELAVKFHSTLESLTEHVARASSVSKDDKAQCLPLLLKCLKIMENATFLSKENQSHLLRLKGNVAGVGSLSFVKLMVNFIKILSELSLLRLSSATSSPEVPANHSNGADHCPAAVFSKKQVDCGVFSPYFSQECASMAKYSSQTGLSTSQSSQRSFTSESRSLLQCSGSTARSWLGKSLIELSSSVGSGSCSLTSSSYNSGLHTNGNGSNTIVDLSKEPYDIDNIDDMVIDLDDSQDPFAFDEDDCAPSKWDNLPGGKKGRRKQKRRPLLSDVDGISLSHLVLSQEDCSSQQLSSQEDYPSLNPMSNQDGFHNDQQNQIAACGGLETLSFLIGRHFPAFSLSSSGQRKENMLLTNTSGLGSEKDAHLSEQELDFLVSILGLLVNLVENDGDNRLEHDIPCRSRLAAAKISFVCSSELTEVQTGVIPLLCSIFLSNSGAGEAAEEELQSCDDDEAVLQGEKEAEKMIVEAYAALLLAFLSTESKNTRNAIANYLPNRNLKALVPVLDRFVTFHLTLNMISPETHKTVSEVIESCRVP
ncbi:hypothetical protein KSS87_010069 [Heliosperma pusillum]|nr:hypothetical protein KSS87_010069 [Heliosperma pusillum]